MLIVLEKTLHCSQEPQPSRTHLKSDASLRRIVLMDTLCHARKLVCLVYRLIRMYSPHRPYFWNSQSRLSKGQTCRVFSQREMQWKWKACYGKRVNFSNQ